jgi:hypothetical protein
MTDRGERRCLNPSGFLNSQNAVLNASIHEYMFAIAEEIFTTLVAGLDPPTCDVRLFLE